MSISARTRLAVLLGHPVAHSRSPAMMNAAFRAKDLDAVYLAWDLPGSAVRGAVRTLGAVGAIGANVTVPHKELAARAADTHSEEVTLLGAANCLVFEDGAARAHNTDAPGLERALRDDVGRRRGPVLVLGAGGAARATLLALARRGFTEVHIANRDPRRRRQAGVLARAIGLECALHAWETLPAVCAEVAFVINATSAQVRAEALELPLQRLPKGSLVYDLTYGDPPLVRAARRRGLEAHDGSGMLLHQAALAFELWTGKRAPIAHMRRALSRAGQ